MLAQSRKDTFFLFRWISLEVMKTVFFRYAGIVTWVSTHFHRFLPVFYRFPVLPFLYSNLFVVRQILSKKWKYLVFQDDQWYSRYYHGLPGFPTGLFPVFAGFLVLIMKIRGFILSITNLIRTEKYIFFLDFHPFFCPVFPGYSV